MPQDVGVLLIRFLEFFSWIVIARVLISWFIRDPSNPIVRFLSTLVDPLTKPVRKFLTFGMMDFSPIALLLVIHLLQIAIRRSIAG